MNGDEEPRLSARELLERLEPSLRVRTRVRAVAALVAGLAGAVFVLGLWWSEPAPLPGRTRLAFGLLTAFCLAWACYGGWLVRRRVPLFATDRVIAAWIALAACASVTALIAFVAAQRGTVPVPALVVGALFVGAALVLVVRAHRRRAALLRRLRELGSEPQP
ncbi:unnamed protein product [[Actinomadura] parvosata subsp. kistnae]|uniref:Transmembrane transport protein n=1 Tax=[Actinomadura] parvosata subsp. kistnae TaxID=1909395 RepID=A0A1U9ZXK0_9ACTN|nr:hypothetical protein [Nonomuraea sp. ATCC 55076]AQZ62667.1 hypothetical protein BKM31_15440 [Nonomuraea sp. ATCC 55076]SPL88968.1 unnamed protein product [Actinomadura parvosata subsp. kistnae]